MVVESRASDGDQHLSQVGPDAPVMSFVGIGQRRTRDAAPESQMVEAVFDRAQASFDVTKAFAACQLCEGHREKLIHAREATMPLVAAVAANTAMELVSGKVADQAVTIRLKEEVHRCVRALTGLA
jgi:hypothetical protein